MFLPRMTQMNADKTKTGALTALGMAVFKQSALELRRENPKAQSCLPAVATIFAGQAGEQ